MSESTPDSQDVAQEHLDVVVDRDETSEDSRRWLGIQFDCCGAYSRIYRNASGSAYVGWCPQCARKVNVPIGPGGTDDRFFTAF